MDIFGEVVTVTEFSNFQKSNAVEYSFISEKKVVTINGSDIILLTFTKVESLL